MLRLWNTFDDRFFDDFLRTASAPTQRPTFEPAVDVVEHNDRFELRAELPGMKPEEVDVTIDGNTLSLHGERQYTDEQRQKDGYYRLERRYGKFRRTFTLPENIDAEAIAAELANGVLTLKLPKKDAVKPRKIQVTGTSLTDKAKKLISKPGEATEATA
jgi:HSP20 family protein